MKGFLQTAASIIALVVIVSAIGYAIEVFRRRSLQRWARAQDGTFEAGGILEGVPVPEAAAFDARMKKVTYSNVSRIPRPEASYVVAQYHTTWKNTKDQMESFSCVVCFVTLPGTELPPVHVSFPKRANMLGSLLGLPDPPPPLKVPESTAAFDEKFQVTPLSEGVGAIQPAALAQFLPRAVQDELVASESLISGLLVRGNVVRVMAVGKEYRYPHNEVFDVAVRLAAA
ncbi:MAG: hypothetical protein EHM91_12400, partial [Planctomycetota bacterium]